MINNIKILAQSYYVKVLQTTTNKKVLYEMVKQESNIKHQDILTKLWLCQNNTPL